MILQEADLEFNFTDALSVLKFDDKAHALTHCMKAVDFVVELPDVWLFVEVKDPSHPRAHPLAVEEFRVEATTGELRKAIIAKFRDTFLYRWAENKLDKPVHFLSLITFEEALLSTFQDDLRKHLPFTGSERWSRQMALSCHVINMNAWNRNFPKWPVRRLSSTRVS
ncbi:MAG: hypothetical protein K2X81_21815 [Candidatus Obscuribacterales bacterium]|nr:hypothetical protein [Candidatus Obscuribacterales bacterium]